MRIMNGDMNKKHILVMLHPHLTIPGGAGQFALEFGKRLASDMRVIFVAQRIDIKYVEAYPEIEFVSLDGPLTDSLWFWGLLPYWYMKLAGVIDGLRNEGKVVLFSQVFPAHWLGLWYKYWHSEVRYLMYCHEPSAFIHVPRWRKAILSPFKRWLAEILAPVFAPIDIWLTKKADQIFLNSEYGVEQLREVYELTGTIVYPGVAYEKFKPVKFEDKLPYLLTVCRLSKFKNVDVLIEALAKIKNKKIKLWVIGDGEHRPELEALSDRLGVRDRVEFVGPKPHAELPYYFARAQVFVLCSHAEPFGLVSIEALACGTPVIADNSGGPKEIVDQGVNGKLITCDVKGLTKALDEILGDSKTLKKMSEAARPSAQKKFSWERGTKLIKNACSF